MFGIKRMVKRDAKLLFSNMAMYFACGLFFHVETNIVSYCELCRHLWLLAFVNIANDSFISAVC